MHNSICNSWQWKCCIRSTAAFACFCWVAKNYFSLLLILIGQRKGLLKVTCLGRGEVAWGGLDAVPCVQPGPLDASVGGDTGGAVTLGHPGLVRLLAEHRQVNQILRFIKCSEIVLKCQRTKINPP